MSEREFEYYLGLLSRMLRLNAAQRQAIARELRDHLEQRLDELTDQGMSRDDAIAAALDEFGDAAGLANDLSHIARQRKRRTIMRYTITTTAGLAVTFLLVLSLIPGPATTTRHRTAIAASGEQGTPIVTPVDPPGLADATRPTKADLLTAKKLAKRIPVIFDATPLQAVFDHFRTQTDTDVFVNWHAIREEIAVDEETPITLQLRNVRADALLGFVSKQVGGGLRHDIEDGIVVITSASEPPKTVIRVYNCRDLLKLNRLQVDGDGHPMPEPTGGRELGVGRRGAPGQAARRPMPMGMGMPMDTTRPSAEPRRHPESRGRGGMANRNPRPAAVSVFSGGRKHPPSPDARVEKLSDLIRRLTEPESWAHNGGDVGSIAAYDGLLVVRHSRAVHASIEQLLAMIRAASRADAR